jgi:hypothetical protein
VLESIRIDLTIVEGSMMNGMRRIAIAICIFGLWIAYMSSGATDQIFVISVAFIVAWIVDGFGNKAN